MGLPLKLKGSARLSFPVVETRRDAPRPAERRLQVPTLLSPTA